MSQNDDLFTYDEDDAVKYIQNVLPQELKEKYSHDDIVYITDVVYDYYEQKGLFDDRDDEEVEIDEGRLIAYAPQVRPQGRREDRRRGYGLFWYVASWITKRSLGVF